MTPTTKNEISEMLATLDLSAEPVATSAVTPGDRVHFLVTTSLLVSDSPSMLGGGLLVERGATVVVSQEMLDLNRDRLGNCFLDMAGDIPRQIRTWGEQRLGLGEFPSDLPRFLPGSSEETDERDRRRAAAAKLPDDEARAERARIRAELGTGGHSTVLGTLYSGSTS